MNVIGHRDEGRIRGYIAWDREGRSEGVRRFRDGVVGHVCKTVIKYWSGGLEKFAEGWVRRRRMDGVVVVERREWLGKETRRAAGLKVLG